MNSRQRLARGGDEVLPTGNFYGASAARPAVTFDEKRRPILCANSIFKTNSPGNKGASKEKKPAKCKSAAVLFAEEEFQNYRTDKAALLPGSNVNNSSIRKLHMAESLQKWSRGEVPEKEMAVFLDKAEKELLRYKAEVEKWNQDHPDDQLVFNASGIAMSKKGNSHVNGEKASRGSRNKARANKKATSGATCCPKLAAEMLAIGKTGSKKLRKVQAAQAKAAAKKPLHEGSDSDEDSDDEIQLDLLSEDNAEEDSGSESGEEALSSDDEDMGVQLKEDTTKGRGKKSAQKRAEKANKKNVNDAKEPPKLTRKRKGNLEDRDSEELSGLADNVQAGQKNRKVARRGDANKNAIPDWPQSTKGPTAKKVKHTPAESNGEAAVTKRQKTKAEATPSGLHALEEPDDRVQSSKRSVKRGHKKSKTADSKTNSNCRTEETACSEENDENTRVQPAKEKMTAIQVPRKGAKASRVSRRSKAEPKKQSSCNDEYSGAYSLDA